MTFCKPLKPFHSILVVLELVLLNHVEPNDEHKSLLNHIACDDLYSVDQSEDHTHMVIHLNRIDKYNHLGCSNLLFINFKSSIKNFVCIVKWVSAMKKRVKQNSHCPNIASKCPKFTLCNGLRGAIFHCSNKLRTDCIIGIAIILNSWSKIWKNILYVINYNLCNIGRLHGFAISQLDGNKQSAIKC